MVNNSFAGRLRAAYARTPELIHLQARLPFSTARINSTYATPAIHQLHRFTHRDSWKKMEKGTLRYYKSIQSGTFQTFRRLGRWPLNGRSFHDALIAFFKPIKNDDPRLDFYTVYKREATEYDTDYVKKYDEDLNITLIFVRLLPLARTTHLTRPCRPVCSLQLAQRSLSPSNQTSSLIRISNQRPSSA